MIKKAVWLVIGGSMMVGCAAAPTVPAATSTQVAPAQNQYQVLGGVEEVPALGEDHGCHACGHSSDGHAMPFGERDTLYANSVWVIGFGNDWHPDCGDCEDEDRKHKK